MFEIIEFPRKEGYAKTITIPFKSLVKFILDAQDDTDEGICKFAKYLQSIDYINCTDEYDITNLFIWVTIFINENLVIQDYYIPEDTDKIAHGDFIQVCTSTCDNSHMGMLRITQDPDNNNDFIIEVVNIDEYNIPKEFESIKNNVPLDYWVDGDRDYLVWVNLDEYRDQCLANITSLSTEFLKTTFISNNKEYTIIQPNPDKDTFINRLNEKGVNSLFRYYYECIDSSESDDDNVEDDTAEDNDNVEDNETESKDNNDEYITLEGGFRFNLTTTLFTQINPF